MAEWFKAAVLKTAVGASSPWVRIPPCPPGKEAAAYLGKLRDWAVRLWRDAVTLWFAMRHPLAPFLAKAACGLAVGYALSPIDLIPDFIPVLGYLDDVILVPALIWLAMRMLPAVVIAESRASADGWMAGQGARPRSYAGAAVVVAIWIGLAVLAWHWLA